MSKKIIIILQLLIFCSLHIQSQVTDATDDLKRKGQVVSSNSIMIVKASDNEIKQLIQQEPDASYFVFPEDRLHDIRMTNSIPERWTQTTASSRKLFSAEALPSEYFTFQLGVWASKTDLQNVSIRFSDLKNALGEKIPASKLNCFNLDGEYDGKPLHYNVSVPHEKIQAFWIGVDIPASALGKYTGKITLKPQNAPEQIIDITLDIKGDKPANHGDNEGWRHSRLRWLNSDIAVSDKPTKPYTPVSLQNKNVGYIGGNIMLDDWGLPQQIITKYDQSIQLSNQQNPILNSGMSFEIETAAGIEILKTQKLTFTKKTEGTIAWKAEAQNAKFSIKVTGEFAFDGFARYDVEVISKSEIAVKDIRLKIPFTTYASKYMMGLNQKGGFRPDVCEWKWDVKKHQDEVWIGNVNAGMRIKLKDENFVRPLVNIYYDLSPLRLPVSWGNEGKGGISLKQTSSDCVMFNAYSGERNMQKGQSLHFIFETLITPLKPLDMKQHIEERYHHSNSDVSTNYIQDAKNIGANVINIHHKKDINPFINYPYYDESMGELKGFINKAHQEGIKTKLYYTTREVTIKMPEIWALRSLNNEVIKDGPGKDTRTLIHPNGPNQWLVDNFEDHFIPAWYNAFENGKYKGEMDISVLTNPDSRWNNFYLEGLDWMIKNMDIDGAYIDDSALDRITLQRARRILDADGKRRMIDMHSWNHFNLYAGYANSALLYLDLFPYADKLWLGEGFSAQNSPDFWLVEVSGIPFGLFSEMLDEDNVWRGMTYCMSFRYPWSGDPSPIWKLWDDFGMADARMFGYWNEQSPVKTNNPNIQTTVYTHGNKALVVLANWSNCSAKCKLNINTDALGFTPAKAYLPEIKNTQWEKKISTQQEFNISGEQGLFIILEKE